MKKFQFYYLAILLLLITNVRPGKAADEPFGSIVKMWEVPYTWKVDSGDILVDTNRQIFIKKSTATEMSIYNLNDGTLKQTLNMPNGIDFYKFIENKAKLAIFTGLYWNSPRFEIYDCNTWGLIKTIPSPDSMSFLSLISDDGKLLIGSNSNAIIFIYDIEKKILKDTIFLERAEEYGYSTKPPYLIEISQDNKYIFTATGYQKWQQLPNATVYNVYDITTKTKTLRFARTSITKQVISNDWKYLYVSEIIYNSQNDKTEVTLYKISIAGTEVIKVQKFIDENFDQLFIADNNKYLVYQPYPSKFRIINLSNYDLTIEPNLLPDVNIYKLLQLKNGYLFMITGSGLACYNINNSILSNIDITKKANSTLFPNPTTNEVRIEGINLIGKSYKMTDITGKDISLKGKLTLLENSIIITMTSFATNTYYFTISDKIGSKTYTIVKY